MVETALTVPNWRVNAVAQVAAIVTFDVMVPVEYVGMQDWVKGCVVTYTVYAVPLAYEVANVWVASPLNDKVSPLSSCSTTVPESPVTVTLTVGLLAAHVAVTVMFEVMVPLALALSVHVWPDGWVLTLTA